MSFRDKLNRNQEAWQDPQQVERQGKYEVYQKKWWEKWILENRKLHYFLMLVFLVFILWIAGYLSGLWWHVGSVFILVFVLVLVEIMRIRRHMYYIVETRLAGDILQRGDEKIIVDETVTAVIEIPDFAYKDFKHVGTNGKPLPVQSSRVVFADYVDLENHIIYHSDDTEFANVVLGAGVNSDIIAARMNELMKVDTQTIEKALKNLRLTYEKLKEKERESTENQKLYATLAKIVKGKLAEIEELKKIVELDETILLSEDFARSYRITTSVKRNLFLHYKNTIPDLRSALFLLQNNLREFADAVATAKLYASLGKTMPLDVRRRLAEVFEKLGYGDIFSIDKKEEVKEHVTKE